MKTNAVLTFDNTQLPQSINGCHFENPIDAVQNYPNEFKAVTAVNCNLSVGEYIHAALSPNTRKSYQSDLLHFQKWGGVIPATSISVCEYLARHADSLSPATLNRRLVAIGRAHTSQGLESPTRTDLVKVTMRGIRRTVGTRQRQVSPLVKDILTQIWHDTNGKKGVRDRALLLIGFAGALRRSELVGLDYSDIEWEELGLVINLRRSKTDQEGEGRKIAIPYARGSMCPVISLKDWLAVSGIIEGALFRPINRHGHLGNFALSTQAVAEIVKKSVASIGLDASKFSGHSLRSGLVTSAAQAGVSPWKIRQQTGHKSDAMLNRYIRDARLFIDNAAGAIL